MAALFAAIGASAIWLRPAAAAQLSSRSIELSSSAAGATGTTYTISFTAGSSYTVQGIVVDFCDNTPLIGDSTCTAPTGFDVGGTSPTVTTSGAIGSSGWTATGANGFNGNTEYRTLELTNGTGAALTGGSSVVTINLTSAVNPSTADHSFYARILTYATTAGATGYAPGSEGSYSDHGGVAMSTASPISITAKVMETLSFCVYHTTCGDSTAITLGHGTNDTLDNTAVDTGNDSFSLSTNAQGGVSVRLKGPTLTSGSDTFVTPGATPATFTPGQATSDFGMFLSSLGTGVSASATYNGGTGGQYGFNTTNTTGTYGDTVATTAGPVNNAASTMQFGAIAANTTPAGIYTAAEQLIATGVF